jgi:hypothetical protein
MTAADNEPSGTPAGTPSGAAPVTPQMVQTLLNNLGRHTAATDRLAKAVDRLTDQLTAGNDRSADLQAVLLQLRDFLASAGTPASQPPATDNGASASEPAFAPPGSEPLSSEDITTARWMVRRTIDQNPNISGDDLWAGTALKLSTGSGPDRSTLRMATTAVLWQYAAAFVGTHPDIDSNRQAQVELAESALTYLGALRATQYLTEDEFTETLKAAVTETLKGSA